MPPAALLTPENSLQNYNWTKRVSPSFLHSKLYNKNYHVNVKRNTYTGCPTRYRTRHFFNNANTNEDIATKQTHTTDTFLFITHKMKVLLFKFRCNIFIGVRIIKEMPGSVASGALRSFSCRVPRCVEGNYSYSCTQLCPLLHTDVRTGLTFWRHSKYIYWYQIILFFCTVFLRNVSSLRRVRVFIQWR
jgi:hypothetical protein